MAERPQVRQFQAPTQADIRPAASPVDTFVAQAKDYTQPSPLAQFLTAITPAIETEANQRKVDRLKREKEIADGITRAKENQIKQQARKFLGTIAQDYMVNEEAYKNAEIADVYQKIRESKEQYIGTLKQSGVDELLVLTFDDLIEDGTERFMQNTLRPAKYTHTQDKLLENFKDGILDIHNNFKLGLYKDADGNIDPDAAMAEIAEMYAAFHSDNNDFFTPSDNRVNDALDALVIDMKDTEPFSILSQYMESKIHSKGQYGTKAKYAKSYDDLKQARAKATKETAKSTAKGDALISMVDAVFQTKSGGAIDKAGYINPETGSKVSFTEEEKELAILSSPQFTSLGKRARYDFLAEIGLTPTSLKNIVLDAARLLETNAPIGSPESLAKLEAGFLQYQAMQNSGMDLSFIVNDDVRKKFDAMQFIIQDQARVGEVTLVDETLLTDPYMEQEARTAKTDYNAAASIVQNMTFTTPLNKEFEEGVTSALNKFTPFTVDLSEVNNSYEITRDITKTAHILFQTGAYNSIDDAVRVASKIAAKDYPIVTDSNGEAYAFKHLNTDISTTMDVVSTINEYNKVLPDLVQNYMFDRHGLVKGEYSVGIYPSTNPNELVIKAYDIRESTREGLPNIAMRISRKALLSNPDQLNQLVAKSLEAAADGLPITTFTPDPSDKVSVDLEQEVNKALQQSDVVDNQFDAMSLRTGGATLGDVITETIKDQESFLQKAEEVIDKPIDEITADDVETIANEFEDEQSSLLSDVGDTLASAGTAIARELGGVKQAAASTIMEDEGFSSTVYDDVGFDTVGHGLQIKSLTADERALIKDINNVQPEESAAVVALKVEKTIADLSNKIEGFENLPQSAQSAAIQMGYQLDRTNITDKKWPKFLASMREAAKYAEGSVEQASALLDAQFNMLYNVAKDGKIYATDWAKQTANRAKKVAEELVANIDIPSIMSEANASTMTIPSPQARPKGTVLNSLDEKDPSSNIIAAPYKALFSNVIGRSLGIEANFSTEDIGEDTLAIIKQATANAEARGSNSVEYGDYPLTKRGLPVAAVIANFKDINGKRLSSAERKAMEEQVNSVYPNNPIGLAMFAYDLQTDPVLKAAGFVGGFSIQRDKSGKKFIKERWNFNNKSTSEGTIYKKMRAFFSEFAPITEDEGSQVYVELN